MVRVLMIMSVKKAMDIVDCVAGKGRMSVKELSSKLAIPKSTVCRLAQTLQVSGYLEQDLLSGDYLLSYKFFRVGYEMLEKSGLQTCVVPVIKQLAEQTGNTVNFTVLDGIKVLYVEKIEVSPIHGGIRVGARAPIHCTASGKAILANLTLERAKEILHQAQPLEAFTENTLVNVDLLLEELAVCRELGYAVARDELGNGAHSVAAFVKKFPGREAAAISLAGPQIQFANDRIKELGSMIRAAAEEITRRLEA